MVEVVVGIWICNLYVCMDNLLINSNNVVLYCIYFSLDLGDVNVIVNVIVCMYNLRICMYI